MPWNIESLGAKYNTAKSGVVESIAKAQLWDKNTQLKVSHQTKTNNIGINFKTKTPIEIEIDHDVKPKTTTFKAELELFNDKVDLKIKQVIPGNKWSCVPSPRLDAEFEPSDLFESNIHWDFAARKGGAKLKSKINKKHELVASAVVNSKFEAQELRAEYEFMPKKKFCDEIEIVYSTKSGVELQWETKPNKVLKTDLKGNLKSKKITAEIEYKTLSKKPMVKTVLSLGCPVDKPSNYTLAAKFETEYKF